MQTSRGNAAQLLSYEAFHRTLLHKVSPQGSFWTVGGRGGSPPQFPCTVCRVRKNLTCEKIDSQTHCSPPHAKKVYPSPSGFADLSLFSFARVHATLSSLPCPLFEIGNSNHVPPRDRGRGKEKEGLSRAASATSIREKRGI